jgi:hypothetical protein
MLPIQAPALFNMAVSEILDIAEAMPAYAQPLDILAADKSIRDLERAVKTLRDCHTCMRLKHMLDKGPEL